MTESIPAAQLSALKKKAHHLKPLLRMGNHGLSDAFVAELEVGFAAHELVKIKLAGIERADKKPLIAEICEKTGATLIDEIGFAVTLYKRKKS